MALQALPAPASPGSPPSHFTHFCFLLSSGHISSLVVPEPSVPPTDLSDYFSPCSSCCCCLEGSFPRDPLAFLSSLFRPHLLREGLPDHSIVKASICASPPDPPHSALPFLSFSSTYRLLNQFSKHNVHAVHQLVNLLNPDSDSGRAWGFAHPTRSQVLPVPLVQASDFEKQGSNSP